MYKSVVAAPFTQLVALFLHSSPIKLLPEGASLVPVSLVCAQSCIISIAVFPVYCSCSSVNVDNFPMTTLKWVFSVLHWSVRVLISMNVSQLGVMS